MHPWTRSTRSQTQQLHHCIFVFLANAHTQSLAPMGGRTITAKALQGKKGNGSKDLHPKSRRVKQAARVELRTKKVADGKKERKSIEEDKSG